MPSRGRGRGRGFSSPPTRDSGWSGRRPSSGRPPDRDFDRTKWEPKSSYNNPHGPVSTTSSIASSSGAPEPSTSKKPLGWGNVEDASKTTTADDNAESSGWGGGGWGGGGWGSTSASNADKTGNESPAWGAPSDSAWGLPPAKPAAGGDDAANKPSTGWGTSPQAPAWGSSSATGWGSTSVTPANEHSNTGKTSKGWGASPTAWTAPPSWDVPTPASSTNKATNAVDSSLTTTQGSRPKNLRIDTQDKAPIDPPGQPQSASTYRAASMAPSEPTICVTPQSTIPPSAVLRYTGPMSRDQIHTAIIRNAVRVTRIRIELKEVQTQLDRWKLTQLSPQFHHISTPAGQRLDSIRNELKSKVAEVQSRLKQAEGDLVALPELTSSLPNLTQIERELGTYSEQLAGWFRSFSALATPETTPAPAPDPSAMDVDADESNPKPPTPADLFTDVERRLETLQEDLDELQLLIIHVSESTNDNVTHLVEKTIADARQKMLGQQAPAEAEGNTAVTGLQNSANDSQATVDRQVEQIVLLIAHNDAQRALIVNLEKERDRNRELLEQMQSQLVRHQQRKEERAKQRTLLANQISHFASNPPQRPPVLDENILVRTKQMVEHMIQAEIVPALTTMRTQYTNAIENRMTSLQQSIQPAFDQTNEICQRAQSIQLDS
ncbi:hypothetical protein R3P38DRAFT_1017556 [Favolaschia claudopus]|uniref:Uncharacterized protein n=1 Tax=Favolaschia claudopus TaxID=2862362 RepID=A0AAW0BI25_9AGAR